MARERPRDCEVGTLAAGPGIPAVTDEGEDTTREVVGGPKPTGADTWGIRGTASR